MAFADRSEVSPRPGRDPRRSCAAAGPQRFQAPSSWADLPQYKAIQAPETADQSTSTAQQLRTCLTTALFGPLRVSVPFR